MSSTDGASPAVARGRERSWRLALSLITGSGSKAAAFGTQIVAVPLLITYLGKANYGIYETLTSLSVWLGLTNAGMNLGLLNALIERNVADDRVGARREVASVLEPTLLFVGVASLLVGLAGHHLPWLRLFPGVDARALRPIGSAAIVAMIAALVGVLGAVPSTVYTAYQETHVTNLWDIAARVFGLAACVAVVKLTSWGVTGAALSMALVPALVRAANGVPLLAWEKPWICPRRGDFDRGLLVRNLRQSVVFSGLQATVFAITQSDRLIMSVLRGPAATADYAVVARFFMLAYGGFSMVYAPLWAGYGEALKRGELQWVKKSVVLTSAAGLAAALFLGALQLLAGDRILLAWTRMHVHVSASLGAAFAVMFFLRVWVESRSVVLNSAGVLLPQLGILGLQGVLSIPLAFVLGRLYGPCGVAWAYPVAALATSAWMYPRLLRRCIVVRSTRAAHDHEL